MKSRGSSISLGSKINRHENNARQAASAETGFSPTWCNATTKFHAAEIPLVGQSLDRIDLRALVDSSHRPGYVAGHTGAVTIARLGQTEVIRRSYHAR